jgi:molecular chaperone HscB
VNAPQGLSERTSEKTHFSVFGLAPRFAIDLDALESAWRAIQAAVHPDRFASGTDTQRRLALQWSMQINEAHDTLKDPIRRASYLCHLNGVEVDPERNTAMPADFLIQQMEWRESLEDALSAKDVRALMQLEIEVQAAMTEAHVLIEHLIDRPEPDYHLAAQEVRRMMFLYKFNTQLRDEQRRLAHGTAANR